MLEGSRVTVLVQVEIVAEAGGEEEHGWLAGGWINETLFDPLVPRTPGVAGGPEAGRDVREGCDISGRGSRLEPGWLAEHAKHASIVLLVELCEFVETYKRVTRAGLAAVVACVFEVAEPEGRAAGAAAGGL